MTTLDEHDPRIADWLLREAPPALDEAVVRHLVERTRLTPQRGGWWRSVLAAAGPISTAMIAVAVIVAAVVLVRPLDNADEPVGSSDVDVSTTPTASATKPTTPAPSSGPASWSAIALPDPRPEPIQGENPYDVVAGGPGFVAVGRSYAWGDEAFDDRQWTPAIWTSIDGSSWDLAEDLVALGPAELLAVASGADGRLLAVGFDRRGIGPNEDPPTGVGMWRSSDGIHWEAAPAPAGDNSFMDVINTDEGWLVAGYPSTGGPMIFTSTDLETWTAEKLPGGAEDGLDGLFGDANGRVLAYGCNRPIDDDGRGPLIGGCGKPRGWLRTVETWEAVDLPIVPVVGAMLDGLFVVIGRDEEGAVSFSSVDGRSWVRGDALPGEAYVSSMTRTATGLAAGGSMRVGDEQLVPAVWHSTDGHAWGAAEVLPIDGSPSEPTVTALIETPSGLVGLGYAIYDKPVAQAWIRSRP